MVFDLDGVLIDSEQVWDAVRREVVADLGGRWTGEATTAMQGMSTPEWSRYLVHQLGVPGQPADVATEVIRRMADRYRADLPLLPGAVDAVRAVSERWPLGVASSSPPDVIRTVLAAAGMAVVAVPNPHYPPPEDALRLAAAVAPTVAEVTPELLASL